MSEIERESMEVDVLFVGAGPANLASAYHLMKQVEAHNEAAEKSGGEPVEPPVILVIEKAAGVGEHQLSGAVMNPRAIAELIPDFVEQGFPTEYVANDSQFVDLMGSPYRLAAGEVDSRLAERVARLFAESHRPG